MILCWYGTHRTNIDIYIPICCGHHRMYDFSRTIITVLQLPYFSSVLLFSVVFFFCFNFLTFKLGRFYSYITEDVLFAAKHDEKVRNKSPKNHRFAYKFRSRIDWCMRNDDFWREEERGESEEDKKNAKKSNRNWKKKDKWKFKWKTNKTKNMVKKKMIFAPLEQFEQRRANHIIHSMNYMRLKEIAKNRIYQQQQ